jgi:hypothetical protein
MRKTFPLEIPGHKPPRVIEAIKSDVRKYLKRERRKTLPEGVDYWDFDCRVGVNAEEAKTVHVAGINAAISAASEEGSSSIYVEVLAKAGHRARKNPEPRLEDTGPGN